MLGYCHMPKNFEISDKSEKVLEKFDMEEKKENKVTPEETVADAKEEPQKETSPVEELEKKEVDTDTKKGKKEKRKKERVKAAQKIAVGMGVVATVGVATGILIAPK